MENSFQTYDIAVEGGSFLTMDSNVPLIENGVLLVNSGRIEFLGSRNDSPQYRARKTIQADGRYILPPFFNQHTHLSLSLYRGLGTDLHLHDWLQKVIWPLEKSYCIPENVYLGALLSLVEMIRNGTGMLANMDFHSMVIGKAITEAGLRGFLGEGLFDESTPSAKTSDDTFEYSAKLQSEFAENELISIYLTPHAPFSCSPELYAKTGEIARKWNIPVCSHVCETRQEVETIRAKHGVSPIELLERTGVFENHFILIHGVHLDNKDIEILAKHNVPVIHNPHSNMSLGSGTCPVPKLLSNGVKVGLGTDSAASNNHLSILRELQTAYLIHKGINRDPGILPAAKLLEMATQSGAEIYRMNSLGRLKKGFKADFQIIDLNSIHNQPLIDPVISIVNSMHDHDIMTLVVNGQILMEERKIITLDEEMIIKEAGKFGERVKRSFPGLFSAVKEGGKSE